MRDVKISSIYEGANGIQALDLLGRKIGAKGGMVFMSYIMELNQFLAGNKQDATIGGLIPLVEEARDKLAAITAKFGKLGKEDPYYPVLNATPYLQIFSEVTLAWLLLEQAKIAGAKLEAILSEKGCDSPEKKKALLADSAEAAFYHNKVCTAAFYVSQILPNVFAVERSIATGDRSALDAVL